MPVLDLLVDVVAVHRLTRLATADDLTALPRDALIRWAYLRSGWKPEDDTTDDGLLSMVDPEASWTERAIADEQAPPAARWISCRWCFSVTCAFGVVALRRLAPRWWSPVATALALSSASTLLAAMED